MTVDTIIEDGSNRYSLQDCDLSDTYGNLASIIRKLFSFDYVAIYNAPDISEVADSLSFNGFLKMRLQIEVTTDSGEEIETDFSITFKT